MPPSRPAVLTLALAFLGGAAVAATGLPAGWVAGAMAAVAAAALAGAPVRVPRHLRDAAFVLVGASMGTGVTPESLRLIAAWPLSLTLLAASVTATIWLGTRHLERVRGWDRASARYSSVPGALTSVLVLAATSSADVPRVAFAQTLRLVVLVAVIPPLVSLAGDDPSGTVPGAGGGAAVASPAQLAALIALCAAAALLLAWLRAPGAALLGSMLASAVLHAAGLVTGGLPSPLLVGGFVVTGAVIGSRFEGTRFATIRASLRGAVEGVALAILVAVGFAGLGAAILGVPFGQLFLAFAPGGLETMAILAFLLQLDPAFVGGHHLVRFLALSVAAPLWMPRAAPGVGR